MHDLKHGCDSCTSSDHSKVFSGAFLDWVSFEDWVDGKVAIFVVRHVPWKMSEELCLSLIVWLRNCEEKE
jgi:hypothetical protein